MADLLIRKLNAPEFLRAMKKTPCLDVRSPGEFAKGHIPGALSLPLFQNAERAEIGTLYKKRGRAEALARGLEMTGAKLADFHAFALEHAPGREILVHCWRGGMRSASMAGFLTGLGFRVSLLEGGYKFFRRHVLQLLADLHPGNLPVAVISGRTGSGKTELLKILADQGEQILDLEDLAAHRGSTFGALEERPQPTQEQFENDLALRIAALDPERPVWVEDESRLIGKTVLPPQLFGLIRSAPVFLLEIPEEVRINRLIREYGTLSASRLTENTLRIASKLGGDRLKAVLQCIQSGDLPGACRILLGHYDRTYERGLSQRDPASVRVFSTTGDHLEEAAEKIRLAAQPVIGRAEQ